ncbi:MAG: DUF6428 family protein [Pseudomonadota bacterium]
MTDVTLAAFRDALNSANPAAGVTFATEDGMVGDGYHITELKHAEVKSIDCGGRQAAWDEVGVQILDIAGERPMAAEKLAGILERSIDAIPGLGRAPVHVEFGHGNQNLSRYDVAGLSFDKGEVRVSLSRAHAVCKPAVEKGSGCCG